MAGLGRRTFAAGEVLTASNVMGYLQDQAVMNFAGTAARGSAIASPSEGMVSYLADTNAVEVYDGSLWKNVYFDSGWQTPTLNSGWTNEASNSIQYRLKGSTVYFKGRANSTGTGLTLFTLPVGYRPVTSMNFICDGAAASFRVNITAVGAVSIFTAGSVSLLSLANATFLID